MLSSDFYAETELWQFQFHLFQHFVLQRKLLHGKKVGEGREGEKNSVPKRGFSRP
jgi:hypothetical protein